MKKLLGLAVIMVCVVSLAQAQESTGENTAEGLTGGQIIIEPEITEFEDWNYICITDDEDQTNCLAQNVVRNDQGGRVSTIDIFPIASETGFATGASIALPLGVSLSDGLEFRVEGTPMRKFDFEVCSSEGCIARIGLSPLVIEKMSAGAETKLTVRAGSQEKVDIEITLSTDGFAEVMEELMTNAPQLVEASAGTVAAGEVITEPEIEVFDDWTRVCITDPNDNRQCRIRQIVLNDSGGPIATVDIFKVSGDERFVAGIEILLPHGVIIENGFELQVDSALPRRYQFTTCLRDGCLVRIGVTGIELDRMKLGSTMTMVFYAGLGGASDQQIDLNSSLIGFTRAFDSL